MPHFTLFRPAAHDFSLEVKKTNRRSSTTKSSKPALSERSPSSSASSLISQDGSVRMPENPLQRLAKNILHPSPRNSSSGFTQQPATVDLEIESPPLVLYGSAQNSDGALASGKLKITVHEDRWDVSSFKMVLNKEVAKRKAYHANCHDCAHELVELYSWNFLTAPVTTLAQGVHEFPFSYLFPGNLHASMRNSIMSLEYWLRVQISSEDGAAPLKLAHMVDLKRAIVPSEQPRHSIRIFPPTNIKADCHLPPVIYPIGEHRFSMRLDGAIKRDSDTKTQTHWKLKRLTWSLEEKARYIAEPCPKHAAKLKTTDPKSYERNDTKAIGTGTVTSGWKADYTDANGCIELEFPFSVNAGHKVTCNTRDDRGTEVGHVMVVEMVVFEEYAPLRKLSQVTPTGGARVLRMHFDLNLTERAGLGVSWLEETPPLYVDIPDSPPRYRNGEVTDLPDYEDLQPLEGSPAPRAPSIGEGTAESITIRRRLSLSDLEQEAPAPSRTEEASNSNDEVESGDIYEGR